MADLSSGILLVLLASLFQGSFALFLKFAKPWAWENFWFVYSVIGFFVSPIVWSWILAPRFFDIILSSPSDAVTGAFFFGLLWGVGGLLFGMSAAKIGLSLTYSLALGLTIPIGSLIPLFMNPLPATKTILVLLAGIAIVLISLVVSAYAGMKREKLQASTGFATGLIIAIISGLTSPMANVGFVYGKPIAETAESFGVSATLAILPVWLVVLTGMFLVNAGYTIYLLSQNKTFGLFFKKTSLPLAVSLFSGAIWFAGMAFYGMATSMLGNLGTSVGFGLMLSLMIIVSNSWGIMTGEWKNSGKALKYQMVSILISILGIVVIASSFFV